VTEQLNEQDMIAYIAAETKLDASRVAVVLKHEQDFIDKAEANAKGEVEIDSDELVDYILSRKDVGLNELQVEQILDREMDYLTDRGLAGYED